MRLPRWTRGWWQRKERLERTPPRSLFPPSIRVSGNVLTADVGSWRGANSFTHQWRRNGQPISGATSVSYTLVGADAGTQITVTVTARNAWGTGSSTSQPVSGG